MKNKIFLICFFLLSILLLSNAIFAAAEENGVVSTKLEDFGLDETTYNKVLTGGYIIIDWFGSDNLYYHDLLYESSTLSSSGCYYDVTSGQLLKVSNPSTSSGYKLIRISSTTPTGTFTDVSRTGQYYIFKFSDIYNNPDKYLISGTVPIYTDETLTSYFFDPAAQEVTLAQVLEETKPVEIFKTTIVGFLKYLIAFVVFVIAFWKGWQFLLKQLRQA